MKGWDPEGNLGPKKPLPDSVQIMDAPVDKIVGEPTSDHREQPAPIHAQPAGEPVFQQADAVFEQTEEQPAF